MLGLSADCVLRLAVWQGPLAGFVLLYNKGPVDNWLMVQPALHGWAGQPVVTEFGFLRQGCGATALISLV